MLHFKLPFSTNFLGAIDIHAQRRTANNALEIKERSLTLLPGTADRATPSGSEHMAA